jgi:hypothetical protein
MRDDSGAGFDFRAALELLSDPKYNRVVVRKHNCVLTEATLESSRSLPIYDGVKSFRGRESDAKLVGDL